MAASEALGLPEHTVQSHFGKGGCGAYLRLQFERAAPAKAVLLTSKDEIRDSIEAFSADALAARAGDGDDLLMRLRSYLGRVELLFDNPVFQTDIKAAVLVLDQARKTCETLARLYLDIMRAQSDVTAQNQFRESVLEAIGEVDDGVRQKIVRAIKRRAELLGIASGNGLS